MQLIGMYWGVYFKEDVKHGKKTYDFMCGVVHNEEREPKEAVLS